MAGGTGQLSGFKWRKVFITYCCVCTGDVFTHFVLKLVSYVVHAAISSKSDISVLENKRLVKRARLSQEDG